MKYRSKFTFQYADMTDSGNLMKMSDAANCPHRMYELQRVDHLVSHIYRKGKIKTTVYFE